MSSKYLIFALALILTGPLWMGCEEPIEVNLKDIPPKMVIEGWITTDPGPYQIKLSSTTPYFDDNGDDPVETATVIISDDLGTVDTLSQTTSGVYETSKIVGEKFRTYFLSVETGGETYTASSTINRINPIDMVVAPYLTDIEPLDDGYYTTVGAQELEGQGDFYRFLFYQNDSLYNDASDIFVTDDRFSDGQYAIFIFPYTVEVGDTILIEAWSLTEDSYDYYTHLQSILLSAGNPFGSPPDNVISNISNGALGVFGAVAVERKSVIVVE